MVFSDIFFLYIFLPLFLICYFAAKKISADKLILAAFALLFIAWGEPEWIISALAAALADHLYSAKNRGKRDLFTGILLSCAACLAVTVLLTFSGIIANAADGAVFLPMFIIFYHASKLMSAKNAVLMTFSLFFYAWGEPVWVFLLMGTAFLDYLNGRFIEKHRGEKKAVLGVILSCVIDLAVLGVFKYSPMIVSAVNGIAGTDLPIPEFHMPIGISFYTFQSITYVVDVYRGNARVQKNYFSYLLYISMFFQLVAGPIVRYNTVAREIDNRDATLSEFSAGLTRLVFGLGKKVIIANSMGSLASSFLTFDKAPESVLAAWAGIIAYTLQIYYDFSGYSDMAIGMGLMCGFHFPENFEHPYVSSSVTEFWRRWHISLGTFFRDYLYIPLGGNRRHQLLNIAVVWFCTGLWHGASANFILWGLYFGVLLAIEKTFLLKILNKIPKLFGHIYLIFAVIFGWLIFYFTDMSKIGACLGAMFGRGEIILTDILTESQLLGSLWLIIAAVILCMPVYAKISAAGERIAKANKAGFVTVSAVKLAFMAAVLFLSSISLVGDTYNPFLYFRF